MAQNYVYPSSSEVTINGIGTPNNAPIPGNSVLVAGESPTGNQTVIQTDADGNLITTPAAGSIEDVNLTQVGGAVITLGAKVSASSIPVVLATDEVVPISAVALPLPTGASTSALQTDGNTSLSTIAGNTTNLIMTETVPGTPAAFALTVQGNAAGVPIPVSLTASTGTSSINVAEYGGVATTLGLKAAAASIPVVIASDQVVPVSASTLPLPAGAATAANQATEIASLATIATNSTSLVANQTNGTQKTQVITPPALTVTQAAITVGTTAVRLTVSGSAPSATRQVLVATPDTGTASTVTFYIGSATVTNSGATRGIEIQQGQSFIANNDAADYYIVASVAAQTVTVMEQS